MKSEKNLTKDLDSQLENTLTTTQLNELLDRILLQADKEIAAAFDEGYKQAVIEYKPELDFYKSQEILSKKNKINIIITSGVTGVFIGLLGGIIIGCNCCN